MSLKDPTGERCSGADDHKGHEAVGGDPGVAMTRETGAATMTASQVGTPEGGDELRTPPLLTRADAVRTQAIRDLEGRSGTSPWIFVGSVDHVGPIVDLDHRGPAHRAAKR